MRKLSFSLMILGLLTVLLSCTPKPKGPTFWIYTSFYNHVVNEFKIELQKKFPDVNFQWYQAGSENVAAKINTELLNGKTQADLIMTSDLFWYEDLKAKNVLMAYDSPATAGVPAAYKDPGHFWAVSRVPVMVMVYNSDVFSDAEAPKGFADLVDPKYKNKIAMGSPLESGTTFTTVALLAKKLGWDYFSKLRANGILSAGGNTAVIGRVETKERPVGIVLLENVLAAQRKNPKIKPIYPKEGAIAVPSAVALIASSANPEIGKKVYDYFFSKEGQVPVIKGDIHSIFPDIAPPSGAPTLTDLMKNNLWTVELLHEIHKERDEIKKRFAKTVLD